MLVGVMVDWIWGCLSGLRLTGYLRIPINMKRNQEYSYSCKGMHSVGIVNIFRGLLRYFHYRKHDGMRTDMVLEKDVRVLLLDPQTAKREWHTECGLSIWNLKTSPKGHISFNKATSTTTSSYLLIVPVPMGLWAHFYSNHHTRAMWSLIEAVVQGAHRQASSQADNQTGSWGSLLWVLG